MLSLTSNIILDGRLQSDLDWASQLDRATSVIKKGHKILWELDLGLFGDLRSLHNETQFLSLSLSISHFVDTVWEHFKDASVGVVIYRGDGLSLPWDEELKGQYDSWLKKHHVVKPSAWSERLFCRDVMAEYLDMLACRFPESIPVVVSFDLQDIEDPLARLQWLNQECFPHVHHEGEVQEGNIALMLPSASVVDLQAWEPLREALHIMKEEGRPFRTLSEATLINAWDGLDELIVASSTVTREGIRRLQGFCAAGGTVLTIGTSLRLPNESPFLLAEKR